MFHKVKEVRALENFKLCLQFAEGVTKIYDLNPLISEIPAFKIFEKNPYLFKDVTVDIGGYGIIWNDELDLSCDELWENGESID